MKIDIKGQSGVKHKNIIRILHPTLEPPNGFINLVIHFEAQKQILSIF
jgi:hypothetical protein